MSMCSAPASERRHRKRTTGAGKQVALAQIAAESHQGVPLLPGLDPLGDHLDLQILAEADDRPEQLLLRRRAIDAAHQRHVDLHDLWLELCKARQTGIPG